MNKEFIFPITWNNWDEYDVLIFQYYDVTFIEDFGMFKKGDFAKFLSVNYEKGIIEEYNEDGTKVMKTQLFKAIAI